MKPIPAQNYQKRRANLAAAAKQPLIVITGADLVQKSSDETYEFVQDGYFYYLTGIDEPGWQLVIDTHRGIEFLIAPNYGGYYTPEWDDVTSFEDIKALSGFDDIRSQRDGWGHIRRECTSYQSIGSIVPKHRYIRSYSMFIHPSKAMLVEKLKRAHKDANLVDISEHIRDLRTVKDKDEIALIREAVNVTRIGFEKLSQNLNIYSNEREVHRDLTSVFFDNNASHGYKPVIAAGKNAAILHYKSNNAAVKDAGFLLVDAGASIHNYKADVSRTFDLEGASDRYREVKQEVAAAQVESLNFLKAGVSMRDHEAHIEQVIGESLKKLGVTDNMLRKTIRTYYPHAISHHLGIDTHDSCSYEMPLRPGAVITVEPGIYLPDEGIGVRIEDDILVTESGIEVLTKDIPKNV